MYQKTTFYSLLTCCLCFGMSTLSLAVELELLTFGDSITAGLRRGSDEVITCPEGVTLGPPLFSDTERQVCNGEGAEGVGGYQPTLKSNLEDAGYDVLIYNFGYSGLLTSEMLALTDPILSVEPDSDYVLIMGGANDAFRQVSGSTVKFNIQTMIKKVCEKGMIPVITSVTRRQNSSTVNNIVVSYNIAINSISNPSTCSIRNIQLITADQYNATIEGINFSDGLHLTGTGNNNMAMEWYNALDLSMLRNTEMEFLPSVYLLLDE